MKRPHQPYLNDTTDPREIEREAVRRISLQTLASVEEARAIELENRRIRILPRKPEFQG